MAIVSSLYGPLGFVATLITIGQFTRAAVAWSRNRAWVLKALSGLGFGVIAVPLWILALTSTGNADADLNPLPDRFPAVYRQAALRVSATGCQHPPTVDVDKNIAPKVHLDGSGKANAMEFTFFEGCQNTVSVRTIVWGPTEDTREACVQDANLQTGQGIPTALDGLVGRSWCLYTSAKNYAHVTITGIGAPYLTTPSGARLPTVDLKITVWGTITP